MARDNTLLKSDWEIHGANYGKTRVIFVVCLYRFISGDRLPVSNDKNVFLFLAQGGHHSHGKFIFCLQKKRDKPRTLPGWAVFQRPSTQNNQYDGVAYFGLRNCLLVQMVSYSNVILVTLQTICNFTATKACWEVTTIPITNTVLKTHLILPSDLMAHVNTIEAEAEY